MKTAAPTCTGQCFYARRGKRLLDLALSLPGLIAALPLFCGVALLVRLLVGSPVLFRQLRPGMDGRPFTLIKFRTMRDLNDSSGAALPDAERLTGFGRFLRKTSLDELPELFNVIRGDMSLVGPRPLLSRYLPHYSERERKRHAVRPGITGWAQIHGRNEASWDERLERDVWYVEHRSLRLDLAILARTVAAVLGGAGVVPDARSIMRNLDEERQARREEQRNGRERP